MQREHERADPTAEEQEQLREEFRTDRRVRKLFGRLASVLGIAVAVMGILTPGDLGPAGFTGIVMGALGWALDARRLGTVALVLSLVEILSGIAIE